MTYTKINLYLANGIPEALSNLWYGSDSTVVEIRDAVEDAKNGKDLLNRIQKMKLLRKFTIDRENEKRIRFKVTVIYSHRKGNSPKGNNKNGGYDNDEERRPHQ